MDTETLNPTEPTQRLQLNKFQSLMLLPATPIFFGDSSNILHTWIQYSRSDVGDGQISKREAYEQKGQHVGQHNGEQVGPREGVTVRDSVSGDAGTQSGGEPVLLLKHCSEHMWNR